MENMYGEACFSERKVYKWAKHGFVTMIHSSISWKIICIG